MGTEALMRKLGLLLVVFLIAAAATAVLSRDRWPGPHPRATATYQQRWEEREAEWAASMLPPDVPPAKQFNDALKAIFAQHGHQVTYIDLSCQNLISSFRGSATLNPPLELAGRPPRDVIGDCVERTGAAEEIGFAWTDHGLLLTRPRFADDLNLTKIDAGPIYARWWSPQVLWSQLTAPEGQAPPTSREHLYNRVMREIAPDSWMTAGVEGGGSYGISGNTVQVIHTNAHVAAVEDLIWRIKLEAVLFDSAFAGLAAATLLGSGMASHFLWQRRRRRRSGLCPACGYDLRASPERCPECGLKSRNAAVAA